MKTTKIALIATIITVLIICSCAYALPASAESTHEFYPLLTVVTGWETVGDLTLIFCTDKEGKVWTFYDDETYWRIGDLCNLLMWNLSEIEEEDEIIEVYYEGHLDTLAMIEWFK